MCPEQYSGAEPVSRFQRGVMLLEALIALLIFSIGILAIVGLQATSLKLSGDAKYRSDAAALAEDLLAQMWTSDRIAANMAATYGSVAGGAGYLAWVSQVQATLPGASAYSPVVTVDTTVGTATTGTVAVTVIWQAPSDALSHSHVVTAQIR